MFYNISNHHSSSWSDAQIASAGGVGNIVDLGFPSVSGDDDESKIAVRVRECLERIPSRAEDTVFAAGEYCFTFALVHALRRRGQKVVYANADFRLEHAFGDNGVRFRKIFYRFIDFREYGVYPDDVKAVGERTSVLLNCSVNYPIGEWDEDTFAAAEKIGRPQDFRISVLDCSDMRANVARVKEYIDGIDRIAPRGIILDGHFYTFYMMAEVLMRKGYDVYVKCGDRNASEKIGADGTAEKTSVYKFRRFRKLFAS